MSNFDPSKHPRHPAGSSQGGEFSGKNMTRAADRSAAAMGNRLVDAYEKAKQYVKKLKAGKSEAEIATEAGFPPGHEQHWAFRNGLAHAARDAGSSVYKGSNGIPNKTSPSASWLKDENRLTKLTKETLAKYGPGDIPKAERQKLLNMRAKIRGAGGPKR
jgi:hypothetical protein